MKLLFDVVGKTQPDPFIFEDSGKYYLYVTAEKGVELYTADDPFATCADILTFLWSTQKNLNKKRPLGGLFLFH
jgi:hypothetical protein